MLSDLKRVAERQEVEEESLRQAAALLLARQFLFYDNESDRKSYRMLAQNESYFKNLFDAIDAEFIYDQDVGMVGMIPRKRHSSQSLKKVETLLLLTLRLIYEESLEAFKVKNGCVYLNSEQLLAKYGLATGIEERPTLTELRQMLAMFKRFGLVDNIQDDNRVLDFVLRPSVRLVLNESWLETLQQFSGVSDIEDDEVEPSTDADEPEGEA